MKFISNQAFLFLLGEMYANLKMKSYSFFSENVHISWEKIVVKFTTDVAFAGVSVIKLENWLCFSAACSVACWGDVISFVVIFLQFSDKNEISHREEVTRRPNSPLRKKTLKKYTKKNTMIVSVYMHPCCLRVDFKGNISREILVVKLTKTPVSWRWIWPLLFVIII